MQTQAVALDSYQQTIRVLSDRIVAAQKPIRLLDAIKWDDAIKAAFFEGNCKEFPPVDQSYYSRNPLSFEPEQKREEFYDIERDIRRQLGQFNSVGNIMLRLCREYRKVVDMIELRGTPQFSRISQDLYGSADDVFHAGDLTLNDLAEMVSDTLNNLDGQRVMSELDKKTISSEQAVEILQERLGKYFAKSSFPVEVRLSDGIIADAAAGADYIKIRKDAWFSQRDIDVLEVHEGWVHLGTTLNGLNQPVCTFLS
ncbi:MAG TPA: tyrosine/phenylalanine carboxypeptidase domain-containing protein, partial [Leptolyngbyaceae cyanobacterium]